MSIITQADFADLDRIAQAIQQDNRRVQERNPDYEAWLEEVSNAPTN